MGIFINMKIADTVTQKEWEPVYEKSLLMAKKFGFFDFGRKNIHGEDIMCIFPTVEREFNGEIGWRVIGSFPEYKRAEDQFMPKYLSNGRLDNHACDMLCTEFPDYVEQSVEKHGYRFIWGNKTQGDPYHMGLLAIACMVEQMLGVQAMVGGDITYGQCVNAAKMASYALGEQIQPPISCRLNDLHERIAKFDDLNEIEKLKLLMSVYLGEENDEYGAFLRRHYSYETLTSYWREKFSVTKIDTYGFNSLMKRYFLLSPDLRRFCELANFDKKDVKLCTTLIQKILKSSLHIKKKDCYDPLDYKHYEIPYSIWNLMASFALRGAANPAIDRYIPLDEIRTVLTDYFSATVNVNEIIDKFLAEEENRTEESGHELLMKKAEEFDNDRKEKHQQYDICEYEELHHFKPDCKFSPGMVNGIKNSFNVFSQCGESSECTEHLIKTSDKLFHILAANFDGIFLTAEHWEHIYDELCRDKLTFKRFYPMTRVSHNGDLEYLLRAFVTDDAFWSYCCENYTENAEN